AFRSCYSLLSIEIPEKVESVGKSAFDDCDYLVEIINKSNIQITAGDTDYEQVIEVHSGESKLVTVGTYVFFDGESENYLVYYTGDPSSITLPDGFEGEDYAIHRYVFRKRSVQSVDIPDCVTAIGTGAFYECIHLKSLTISSSVKTVGNSAFYGCSWLKSVALSEGLEAIGNAAFGECTSLQSIVIPDSVTNIGRSAFYRCSELYSIVIPDGVESIGDTMFYKCESLRSVVIGEGPTSIGKDTFWYCENLDYVVIPKSVTSIGESAFELCIALNAVYYGGTEAEWGEISINNMLNYNEYLRNANRYYYSEEEPSVEGNFWHLDNDGKVAVWKSSSEA
ncbi:MAG: leucine-rich repeat domain-containing protein, partial [Clostridia bacterium]|nr:leucine-rich repeat domain-containing protein [Clostridia bacterium]